jgi:hypothetical protein
MCFCRHSCDVFPYTLPRSALMKPQSELAFLI